MIYHLPKAAFRCGLYIGRLRNCLPFLTSFTQCRMANLHINALISMHINDSNATERLGEKTDHGSMRFGHIRANVQAVRPNRLSQISIC